MIKFNLIFTLVKNKIIVFVYKKTGIDKTEKLKKPDFNTASSKDMDEWCCF